MQCMTMRIMLDIWKSSRFSTFLSAYSLQLQLSKKMFFFYKLDRSSNLPGKNSNHHRLLVRVKLEKRLLDSKYYIIQQDDHYQPEVCIISTFSSNHLSEFRYIQYHRIQPPSYYLFSLLQLLESRTSRVVYAASMPLLLEL